MKQAIFTVQSVDGEKRAIIEISDYYHKNRHPNYESFDYKERNEDNFILEQLKCQFDDITWFAIDNKCIDNCKFNDPGEQCPFFCETCLTCDCNCSDIIDGQSETQSLDGARLAFLRGIERSNHLELYDLRDTYEMHLYTGKLD